MRRWLRWRIVYLLDRSPRMCWAELVGWPMGSRRLILWRRSDREDIPLGSGACRAESMMHRDCSCYCGKFRNGQVTKRGKVLR
jgi:hypothetical protein